MGKSSSLKSIQSGSDKMSETYTGDLEWAAVPQEPTDGPISIPSIAAL